MNTKYTQVLAATALLFTACGGDKQSSGAAYPSTAGSDEQGEMSTPGLTPASGTTLEARVGDERVPIQRVLLLKDADGNDELLFFRDDVDCARIIETEEGPDLAVFSVEVEPGTDGIPRLAAPMKWRVSTEDSEGDLDARPEQLTITSVPASESVEGRVSVAGYVDDKEFRAEGPFSATVCEVSMTGVPID